MKGSYASYAILSGEGVMDRFGRWSGRALGTLVVVVVSLVLLAGRIAQPPDDLRRDETTHSRSSGDVWSSYGLTRHELMSRGQRRSYVLFVPRQSQNFHSSPTGDPLVIGFHGMGRSADYMIMETGWLSMATCFGFVVCFPDGLDGQWTSHPDSLDVHFFGDLLVDISTQTPVDRQRVYVLGLSNGGFYASAVALVHATKVTAVVNYMGGVYGITADRPAASERNVPYYGIVGSMDPMRPASEEAARVFRERGHAVTFDLVEGFGHRYDPRKEAAMWAFFQGSS